MDLKNYLNFEWIENASEKEQLDFIAEIAQELSEQKSKKPSEQTRNPLLLCSYIAALIGNASDKVKLELVKVSPHSCDKIPNCSQEIQLEAVKLGELIGCFPNASEEMQLASVRRNPPSIGCIKNPTKKVQLEAIIKSNFNTDVIYNCPDWRDLKEDILNSSI